MVRRTTNKTLEAIRKLFQFSNLSFMMKNDGTKVLSKQGKNSEFLRSGVSDRKQKSVNILNLKKKSPLIEFHTEEIKSYLLGNWRPIVSIFGIFFVLLSFGAFFSTRASVATYYPTACLGGWQNTSHAEGSPDVTGGREEFNKDNSAIVEDAAAEIYCSGFSGESFDDTTVPKKFVVKFSWLVDNAVVKTEAPVLIDQNNIPDAPTDTSTTGNIDGDPILPPLDSTNETTAESKKEVPDSVVDSAQQTSDTKEPVSVPAEIPAPAPVSVPEPIVTPTEPSDTVPPPATDAPQSFLNRLFTTVLAQDVVEETPVAPSVSEEATTQPAPVPEQSPEKTNDTTEVIPEIIATPDTESSDAPVSVPEVEAVSDDVQPQSENPIPEVIAETPADGFLEVSYTVDGTTWQKLGTVSKADWQNASFEISDQSIATWGDVSKLQISIKKLATIDESSVVYLDSMYLEVEYDNIEVQKNLPLIELKDEANSNISSDSVDYDSNDTPVFTITDPDFSVYEIESLVKEGKAEIKLDTEGVFDPTTTDKSATKTPDDATGVIVLPEPTTSTLPGDISEEKVPEPKPADPVPAPENKENILEEVVSFLRANIAWADPVDAVVITEATVLDSLGNVANIPTSIQTVVVDGESQETVKISKPGRTYRPGKYTLRVTVRSHNALITSKQSFTWGVLVMNFNKSIYEKDDRAYLQMGVLDNNGHTICDASLKLEIQDPDGHETILQTSDGSIALSSTCGKDNVTDEPDYFTHHNLNMVGAYKTTLTNLVTGQKVKDSFAVKEDQLYEIERVGATRINPYKSSYVMHLKVTAKESMNGTLEEQIPENFEILEANNGVVSVSSGVQVIRWSANLNAGEVKEFSYEYLAEQKSPEIFLLGESRILDESAEEVFKEARSWQLASDAAITSAGSGPWNTPGTWVGGVVPGLADTVTIANGHTVTIAAAPTNSTIASLTIATGATAGGVTFSGAFTLNVTGAVTVNAPTAAVTKSITLATGTLNVGGGLTINSGTAGTRIAQVTATTGTLNVTSGGISFSGTVSAARLTTTGAATINITGAVGFGGTIAINAGTTVHSVGTASFAAAYTWGGALTVDAGSTLSVNATTTVSGVLTVASTGTLTMGNAAFTKTGTSSISGTVNTAGGATGLRTFSGLVTINAGGVWDLSGQNPATSFAGGITMNGTTFNNGTGAAAFSLSQNLAGSSNMTFGGTVTPAVTRTITNNNTAIVTISNGGSIVLTGNWTQGAGSTLQLGSLAPFSGAGTLTATALTNTVEYNGAAQTVKAVVYRNLTLSNSGAKTVTGVTTVNGNFTMSGSATATTVITTIGGNADISGTAVWTTGSTCAVTGTLTVGTGATFTMGNFAFTVTSTSSITGTVGTTVGATGLRTFTGLVTINAGGVWNLFIQNPATSFAGGITMNGTTFNNGTGAAAFSQTQALSGTGDMLFGGTVTPAATRTVTNNNQGVVSVASTGSIVLTGNWTQGTGSYLSLLATAPFSGAGTFDALSNTNTVDYTGAAQTVKAVTYSTLTLSTSGAKTMTGVTTVNSDFNMSGSATASTVLTTIGGNATLTGTSVWTSNAIITVSGNLDVGAGTTLTMGNFVYRIIGTSDVTGTVNTATGNTGNRIFNGLLTINAGGIWDLSGQNPATSFATGIIHNGTTFNNGTGAAAFSATQALAGSSNMTFGGTVTPAVATTLTNNNTGIVTISSTGSIVLTGNWTQGANSSLTVAAVAPFSGAGTLDASTNTNTITYTGSGTTTKAIAYSNLSVNSAGTVTLGAATTVAGNLTITAGTLDADVANNYGLTVGGNWSNAGTFTPRLATVTLNTATTATVGGGPTTFYNLTIATPGKEVDFSTTGTHIIHVTNNFTATGSYGNNVKLYSTTGGTKWHFHPTGTATVDYVTTKDGGCESGAVSVASTHFLSLGNNEFCWSGSTLTFAISANSIGFGALTTGITGSGSHTLTIGSAAPSGFVLTYKGPTLTSGLNTIPVYTSSASSAGTAGFGINLMSNTVPAIGANPVSTTGTCGVAAGYGTANSYSFVANTSTTISNVTGPAECVYTASYVGNISSTTPAGSYSTPITYILTGTF